MYTIFPIDDSFIKLSAPLFAYAYFLDYRQNLMTGEIENYQIENWYTHLSTLALSLKQATPNLIDKRVIHLFYELGVDFVLPATVLKDCLLAIDIQYLKAVEFNLARASHTINFEQTHYPSREQYEEDFDLGVAELKKGNCYQFNLTYDFKARFSGLNFNSLPIELNHYDFIENLWSDSSSIGSYAHATYIPILNRLYLSNSPECLFQLKEEQKTLKLRAMPIKGSLPCSGPHEVDQIIEKFKVCSKNTAELNMITDLLRNDLNRIEKPIAKVLIKKAPLYVPGILHQYSLISVDLNTSVNLFSVLKALFPGGSITGAPKKRVMEILQGLEKRPRGFYCGSTVLFYKHIRSASINIRSAVVDLNDSSISYGAGGGITLESSCHDEYEEMILKYKSFFSLLTQSK